MRLLTRLTLVLFSAAIVAATPGVAMAQRCEAPPGSSAVDQYCEAIPEGGGTRSSDNFDGAGGRQDPGGNVRAIPAQTQERLRGAGADGAAVVGLAAASTGGDDDDSDSGAGGSAVPGGTNRGTAEQGGVKGENAQSSDPSGNPLKAVSASVENGATIGGVFIWALLGVACLAAVFAWLSFRRGDSGDEGAAEASTPSPQP